MRFSVKSVQFHTLSKVSVELGDINEALNYTSLAKRCGYQGMQAFVDEPMLAPLRNHPRFAQALAGG